MIRIKELQKLGNSSIFLLVGSMYFFSGLLGQTVAIPPGNVTPLWPPSGVALVALIFFGKRAWTGILVGAFIANIHAFFSAESLYILTNALMAAVFIAIGSLLQPMLGYFLLTRRKKSELYFQEPNDYIYFVLNIPIFCLVSASIGVTSLCLSNQIMLDQCFTTWMTWWLGDSVGVLLFTPLIYLAFKNRQSFYQLIKASPYYLILILITCFSFQVNFLGINIEYPLVFLIFPFLIYLCYHYNSFQVNLGVLLVTFVASMATINGYGQFAVGETNLSLLLLESFIFTATFTSMLLSLFFQFQNQTEQRLEKTVRDKTREIEKARKKAITLSRTDPLTGLYNRRAFYEEYEKLESFSRRHKHDWAVMMIDIDHFKSINDQYGHDIGDAALQRVARCLEDVGRKTDFIARFGGEEFIIALSESKKQEAFVFAERIRSSISNISMDEQAEIKLTISIGLYNCHHKENFNVNEVIHRADKALYLAKNNGRNRVECAN